MELKRVVVTGMGALTPVGNNLEEFWNNLLLGKSGAAPITRFDTTHFKTKFACEVKDFDILNFMDRKEARKTDLYAQYALITAQEAIANSGLDLEKINKDRVGVIWASGIGGIQTFEDEVLTFGEGGKKPRFNPFFITKMISNMASGLISIKYGFHGINFAPVSACASATNAIADAFNYIRLGKANIIVAGGSEATVTQTAIGGFSVMKALSENNENPTKASRPFDQNRDGFVSGEGAGALILEELEHALQRGATIYAELAGCGFAADAYHISSTHPEGKGAILSMNDALNDANLQPKDIDYLNAHATATPVGDISESKAIEKVFENHLDHLHISATKSMTGHLLGAAGAIEAIACIMSIRDNHIPPTINLDNIDSMINPKLQLTPNQSVQKTVNVAMSNTFGFGGHNAIAIFKRFEK